MTKIRCFINHSDKMVITTESYTSGKAFDKAYLEVYQDGKKSNFLSQKMNPVLLDSVLKFHQKRN